MSTRRLQGHSHCFPLENRIKRIPFRAFVWLHFSLIRFSFFFLAKGGLGEYGIYVTFCRGLGHRWVWWDNKRRVWDVLLKSATKDYESFLLLWQKNLWQIGKTFCSAGQTNQNRLGKLSQSLFHFTKRPVHLLHMSSRITQFPLITLMSHFKRERESYLFHHLQFVCLSVWKYIFMSKFH